MTRKGAPANMEDLLVYLWRRGRGIRRWRFSYYTSSSESWFTSPGWYHKARLFVYRLSIDHDYPSNPIWIGRRWGKRWLSVEALYEPLFIVHKRNIICNTHFANSRKKGRVRVNKTRKELLCLTKDHYQSIA